MSVRFRIAVIAVAWLVLAPIAILVPGSSAQAAPVDDAWTTELEFGTRVSSSEPAGLQRVNVRLAAAQVDCTSIVWKDSPACGGPTPPDPAAPTPTPTPIPTSTPVPTPTPDRAVIQAEALAEAEIEMDLKLDSVSWQLSPEPDELQIVGLDTYLYAELDWLDIEETSVTKGPPGWEVEVTLQAKPKLGTWTFEEQGATGRTMTVSCDSAGNLWDPATEAPAVCPKIWENSSPVTGDVDISYELEYEGTWTSTFSSGGTSGPWTIDSDQTETVTVSEVLAFGWSPKNEHDDGSGCGGFWGWACKAVKIALEVGLQAVYLLAPWIEPFVDFLKGCGDAVIEQLGGLVNLAKQAYEAVTNTEEFVNEKIGLLKEMFDAAKADPEGFLMEMVGSIAELEYLDENGKAQYVGKMLCGLAIDYLSGKAFASIAQKLEKFLGRKRNKNGDLCPISSFPGDTLVLMADETHRRIDSIRPGDYVLSHNLAAAAWEPKLVTHQWSHLDTGPAATLALADRSTVTATDDHLFWVTNTQTWTQLQWVKPGDQLLSPDGIVDVDHVSVGPRHQWTVWELTVAGNHNFTVVSGDTEVLVHNCGSGPSDNKGREIPGTDRRIGDGPKMDPGPPPRILRDDGSTLKPRQPTKDNPNFDHDRTTVNPDGTTTYYLKDGQAITYDANGFPQFKSDMDVYLEPGELGSGKDWKDFGAANDKVKNGLNSDPSFLDDFPQEVRDFYAQDNVPNKPPPGYTWHHHQDTGLMQLVDEATHGAVPHTGGASIWGKSG